MGLLRPVNLHALVGDLDVGIDAAGRRVTAIFLADDVDEHGKAVRIADPHFNILSNLYSVPYSYTV